LPERRQADEGVAAPPLAVLHGLEQERGAGAAEPVVDGEGGGEVGEDLAADRHDLVVGGESAERRAVGDVAHQASERAGWASTGLEKHVAAPVWHAPAPCWSTRTRSTSPSQSAVTSTTVWVLPLVAPLCQRSPRLRDQNTV